MPLFIFLLNVQPFMIIVTYHFIIYFLLNPLCIFWFSKEKKSLSAVAAGDSQVFAKITDKPITDPWYGTAMSASLASNRFRYAKPFRFLTIILGCQGRRKTKYNKQVPKSCIDCNHTLSNYLINYPKVTKTHLKGEQTTCRLVAFEEWTCCHACHVHAVFAFVQRNVEHETHFGLCDLI